MQQTDKSLSAFKGHVLPGWHRFAASKSSNAHAADPCKAAPSALHFAALAASAEIASVDSQASFGGEV